MEEFQEIINSDRKGIKEYLLESGEHLERILDVTNSDSCPHWLYGFVISFLTGLDISEDEAKEQYFNILKHKYHLSEQLQRDIGFRVATLDYFFNLSDYLKNPKFVEIDLFEKILTMSKEDTKLGCYNLSFFEEMTNNELKRADRSNNEVSVILIDIDNFKDLNDKFGHLFGDKILEKFVGVVKSNLRSEDILARFGGDEFIVLLPETGRIGARSMAERIMYKQLEYFKNREYIHERVVVTFSAGIATYPYDSTEYKSLIDFADKALYRAKSLGKNMIYDFLVEQNNKINKFELGENRQFKRFRVFGDNDIDIYCNNSSIDLLGKILNISTTGAFIECKYDLSAKLLNKQVDIGLQNILKNKDNRMRLSGNVVRISDRNDKIKFYFAMKFDNILNNSEWNSIENSAKISPL